MNLETINDIIEVLEMAAKRKVKDLPLTIPARACRSFRGCVDCKCQVEPYMVDDELWAHAFLEPKQLACIACLEKRLQRRLRATDLTTSLININLFYAYRMGLTFAKEVQDAVDRDREQESARPHFSSAENIRFAQIVPMPNGRR